MSGTVGSAEGAFEQSDSKLHKSIGLFGLIALAVSVQIGSGWLLATLAAASIAGPASILTWVFGAPSLPSSGSPGWSSAQCSRDQAPAFAIPS